MILFSPTGKISKELMKNMNQKLILRMIKDKGPLSKPELAKHTGLTLPAITDITNELESLNLIKNLGQTKIKRGRFPTLYTLNEQSYKSIGIVLRSKIMKGALVNLQGEILEVIERPLPEDTSPDSIVKNVQHLVDDMLRNSETSKEEILGLGVGMHGIVDHLQGISVFPPHLQWDNVPIKQLLEDRIGIQVKVDNDCNTLALSERTFGAGKDASSFIVLNVDYGIGAGIMIDGHLFHGADFGAGQIGHTRVDDDGPLCTCGNYGCLEIMSSETAMLENFRRMVKKGFHTVIEKWVDHPDHIEMMHIYQAAEQGDRLALQTLEMGARYLGIGLATLVNVFNPEKVIITGGILRGQAIIMDPILETFRKHALKTNIRNLQIVPSQLGENGDVLGAASLWIEELFNRSIPLDELLTQKLLTQKTMNLR